MKQLNFEINPDKYNEVTPEEVKEVQEFCKMMTHLADEGFITMEEDPDGEVRFYPSDDPEAQKFLQKLLPDN